MEAVLEYLRRILLEKVSILREGLLNLLDL